MYTVSKLLAEEPIVFEARDELRWKNVTGMGVGQETCNEMG